MKVLLINSVCGFGSTGRIVVNIAENFKEQGHEVKIAFGRKSVNSKSKEYSVRIGNWFSVGLHYLFTKLFDRHGLGSRYTTRHFLRWAEKYDPDLLWIHNIHGYYINYTELFQWIKTRPEMKVRWTLHDCWAFTGHCSHFLISGCNRWRLKCYNCMSKKAYPSSLFIDRSTKNYKDKKESFTGVKKMKIITPSNWLRDCVKDSFLKEYEVETVYNTVDKKIFYPTPDKVRIRQVYRKYLKNVEYDKKILLGVASVWTDAKGYADFVKLSQILSEEYQVVLVGVSPKQMRKLPKQIVGIPQISSQEELCFLYNGACYYINLTYEDTFPTTNLEAAACGASVITYDTGGCRETVGENAHVVGVGNLKAVVDIITN